MADWVPGPWRAGARRRTVGAMSGRLLELSLAIDRRAREQRGQTAAEYLGVLLVVSVIIVGLIGTDIGHTITEKLSSLVRDIAGDR